jgi:hypothetical protein
MDNIVKPENLLDKIKESFERLTTLEIITIVGQIKLGADLNSEPEFDGQAQEQKAILTRISLLNGDIRTIYHPEFVTGAYQSLKDFHEKREKEGFEIIKNNIEVLQKLFIFAQELLNIKPKL